VVRGKGLRTLLHEDLKLRDYLKKRLHHAGISKVEIERAASKRRSTSLRPAPDHHWQEGSEVESLKKDLAKLTDKEVFINIQEVRKPEIDAQLSPRTCLQLERRVAFRRAMKKAVSQASSWCRGIKIECSGRLGGAEMSRREWYREGRVPCTPCVPTSTTASPKPRRPTGSSASRFWSSRVKSSTANSCSRIVNRS